MQTVIIIALLFWLSFITALLIVAFVIIKKGVGGLAKDDIKKMFTKVLTSDSQLKEKVSSLEKETLELKKEGALHVQKIGFVRYNPFSETGGNNSFSISFLNSKDSGIVITGLHSRQGTRVYAKIVEGGKSPLALSTEEKRAITKAKKV